MLLVLSLIRSLQRQVRVNVLPHISLKIKMLVVSVPWFFRALLGNKVRSLLRVGKVRGLFLTTSVMPLHASSVPISEQVLWKEHVLVRLLKAPNVHAVKWLQGCFHYISVFGRLGTL